MRNQHAALTRNDRGGLELRWFPTATDATEVAKKRELPTPARRPRGLLSTRLAEDLGLHPKTVRRAWLEGKIPGVELSPRRLLIPTETCDLIKSYGLGGYIRRIADSRH